MDHTTLGWRAQLGWGAALLTIAVTAAIIDLINNSAYGISISPAMCGVMVIAAAGVIVIPASAGVLGWNWHARATTVICVALTIWAAHMAYSSGQEVAMLSSQTITNSYESAKEKENRAKAILSGITETGSAEELGKLAGEADATLAEVSAKLTEAGEAAKKACARPRSDACARAVEERSWQKRTRSGPKARPSRRMSG